MTNAFLNTQLEVSHIVDVYQNILNTLTEDETIHFSYCGNISDALVEETASKIEAVMKLNHVQKKQYKNFFSLIIEGLQNARIHGEECINKQQEAFVIVHQNKEVYTLTTGNLILNSAVEKFKQRLSKVLNYTSTELKEHYLEVLSAGKISEKGGAGLGLMTMALKVTEKLKYNYTALNDVHSVFILHSSVNTNMLT